MRARLFVPAFVVLVIGISAVQAQGPDVIVGQLNGVANYSTDTTTSIGPIDAFAIGTTSCNEGSTVLQWVASTNQHPVIGQNMFRIKDGVMTQIGQGWLKHGFCALSQSLCGPCSGTGCSTLGIGCSDPYTASRNGTQGNLGPRSQVNGSSGWYPYPYSAPSAPANIGRRVQVPVTFLESSAGAGPDYFVDGQYITPDDSAAQNHMNNVSICPINITGSGNNWNASINPSQTVTEVSMIEHWANIDSDVELTTFDTDETGLATGRFFLAAKVVDMGGGLYNYTYNIYNMNSHAAVGALEVALPAGIVITPSMHAVHHHSGSGSGTQPGVDPNYSNAGQGFVQAGYDNDAWPATVTGSSIKWETDPTTTAANPIRWGTQYTFSFTTFAPPTTGNATVTAWRNSDSYSTTVPVPSGDFILPPTDVAATYDLVDNEVDLTWNNSEPYDSINIERDGTPIASLGGTATMYSDPNTTPGTYTYSVTPVVGGDEGASIGVQIDVPEPTLNFQYRVADATVGFDGVSGDGSGSTSITVLEDPDNVDFPNDVNALSIAFTFDPALIEVTDVTESSALAALDPDFVSPAIIDDGGALTGGVTVGVVIDFLFNPPLLTCATETDILTVDLATNPAGATETTTSMYFEDGVHGAIAIFNLVSVDSNSYAATLIPGTITLEEGVFDQFIRGDANGDNSIDIADPVYNLTYLFQAGPQQCLSTQDTNADDSVDIADPIYNLTYLFQSGPAPPAPFPSCGSSAGTLPCDSYSCP